MEPIRPEDRSITLHDGVHIDANDAWRFVGEDQMYGYALAEAIHQAFERDALPRLCQNCGDLARFGSVTNDEIDRGDFSAVCCVSVSVCNGRNCDLAWDECDHHDHIDPPTEIDRQARLIVDGEYRRRHAENGENNDA